MKKWTEVSAISYLNGNGAEVENNLIIVSKTGLSGLKACSALDFLTNHFKTPNKYFPVKSHR